MGKKLATQPIALPDLQRGRLPSLPAWAERSQSALATNLQRVGETFADVLTLPAQLLPDQAQRAEIAAHQNSLNSQLSQTPENGEEWAVRVADIASKLMVTLGGDKRSELAAEAKGDAFVAALDDVPWWAVSAAARFWYRGECRDENGKPYDFKWVPDPATLRRLSMLHVYEVRGRISDLQKLLDAQPYVDCGAALERGQAAWRGILKARGDASTLKGLTFEQAVELGK